MKTEIKIIKIFDDLYGVDYSNDSVGKTLYTAKTFEECAVFFSKLMQTIDQFGQ